MSKEITNGWIIFFDSNGIRYYFEKMYRIGRCRFSKQKFALFKDILDVNDMLKQVEKALSIYGIVGIKGKIKLMVANAQIGG